jgi:sortase (surface protein transpeptidase)
VAAAVVLALIVTVLYLAGSGSDNSTVAAEIGVPTSASPPPSPTVAAPPSPVPAVIAQAEPTRIAIPEIGYDVPVLQMTTATTNEKGEVYPPSFEETYRITDRGDAPGTDADNTVYMICHTSRYQEAPCNVVFRGAEPGQHILVTTPNGTLDYLIEETELYAKQGGEFLSSEKVREVVPGRLVLVTCQLDSSGAESTQDFVVFAQLVTG